MVLIAAFAVVYDTVRKVFIPPTSGSSSPNLGAGALIAALLSAPFVIWGTYIKYQSLGFQREGHITDRISKAVEQLGAEKTVKRDGCDLSNARLQGANLARSGFEYAEFRSADLSGARMHECLLNYANFTNCRLIGTFWHGVIYNSSQSFDIGLWHSDLAIWIEAADVTAVRFNPKNEGKFFGSRDTIVAASYRDDQAVALDLASDISLRHLASPEDVALIEAKIAALSPTAKQFTCWNPYSAGDMAAFEFRDKFIEKHNLKGWPHDDTPARLI